MPEHDPRRRQRGHRASFSAKAEEAARSEIPSPALDERTLLRELNHRINNELECAINLVAVAAVRSDSHEVKVALGNVVELLQGFGDAHLALRIPEGDTLVAAADQVRRLGLAMWRSRLDRMKIALVFAGDPVQLEPDRCWRLGLAVHELVTNSVRHAAFDGRSGEIGIRLRRVGQSVRCSVSDNGSAAAMVRPGRGLTIVGNLAASLGGRIERHAGRACFVLAFPLTKREQLASREAAPRLTRPARLKRTRAAARPVGGRPRPGFSERLPVQPHGRRAEHSTIVSHGMDVP